MYGGAVHINGEKAITLFDSKFYNNYGHYGGGIYSNSNQA